MVKGVENIKIYAEKYNHVRNIIYHVRQIQKGENWCWILFYLL